MKGSSAINLWLCFLTLFSVSLKGCLCLFLKHSSSRCIGIAKTPHLSSQWAQIWYLQLTNDCSSPEAQFHFINHGALQHVSSSGCVLPSDGKASPPVGTKLVVFAGKNVCANRSSQAYIQTDYGSLRHASLKCIQPHVTLFSSVPSASAQIEYTASCNTTMQYFVLGSVTCEENNSTDMNCPPSQVIKVTKANYGGYGSMKTCGYNRNYDCLLPSALCHVKRACDGRESCEMEVTTDEFKEDACPSMKKYLYVEYKCIDKNAFEKENLIVKKIRLASENTPGRGFVELLEDSKPNTWQRLCVNDMKATVKAVVCRTLGYSGVVEDEQSSVDSGQEDTGNLKILHGNLYCNSKENNVFSCCLEKIHSEEKLCPTMARVSCSICSEPILSSKHHPVAVYSASNSLPGYSADQAAMSSNSTWCTRDSAVSHDYLKVDLGEAYVITQLAILGDVPRGNWVTAYEVLYSKDETDWLPGIANAQNRLPGNSGSGELASAILDSAIHARFIKVFPKSWQGYPCLKLEICGHRLLPAAPTNFTLRRLTAYTADLTWIKPTDTGDGQFTNYQISLYRDGKLDSNTTTQAGSWHFTSLRPYTKYSVVVQAGNGHGYGEKTELTFRTNSTAPTAPPLEIKLSPVSSTSFSVSWKPPPLFYRNGIISGYEVCFAWVKSDEHCDRIIRTTAKSIHLGYLSPGTQYMVKVLARNDGGSGQYSEEYFLITNTEAAVCNRSSITSETFVVKLQKPREEVRYCQVLVFTLSSDDSFPDEHLYSAEAVTYLDTSGSPVPYITAEFRALDFEKYRDFTVGDRTLFPALSLSNANNKQGMKYFNGPLTPNTRYTVFQRFLTDEKLLYSSDFLAPVKTNEEVKTRNDSNTSFQAVRPPRYPPRDIKLNVQSSTSIVISWKAPILENTLPTTGYQICIGRVHSDEEDCGVILRTKASTFLVNGLKPASKYKVRVSARNKAGYGKYSKDYITLTNSASPVLISSKITEESFVVKLQSPRKEIRYCQVVLITLPRNSSHPKISQYGDNYNLYHDVQASAQPSSYIAAEFDIVEFEKYREFTVGDSTVGISKYGGEYFNRKLSPDTLYTVYQKFYSKKDLVYISDLLPPTKTKQKGNFDEFRGSKAESKSSQEDFKLPFILVTVLLLIFLLLLGVVIIYKRRYLQMGQSPAQLTTESCSLSAGRAINKTERENEEENLSTRV